MLSASIGAPSANLPVRGAEAKPEIPEQHFDSPAAEEAKGQAGSNAPVVPSTNSAQISVEAVTALQQVQEDLAVSEQRFVTTSQDTENAVAELGAQNDEQNGVAAATAEVQELEEEAAQSRSNSADEVPVGEDTDSAGRSARNPLNLQI
ncbi:hypothetical protein [Sneathiella glossodoripedis]|uniref:hypothetical protein n=1 Tax=Sneathiella glossodoripedis TaxID=418853 RepID=UPI00046EEE95|nr:hypothetical protein [Sneathiella glossodoripedis]